MPQAMKARTLAAVAMAAGLALAPTTALAGPNADPNGNNATIKIDARPFDDAPDNEPHVTCQFQVDFYGYDQGAYNATVNFYVHPPTGNDELLLTDTVFVGEDAAGGGTDLDASKRYQLIPLLRNNFEPHPQQGYHIKVEVNAPFSKGSDKKSKVFWTQSCEEEGNGNGGGDA